MPERAAYIAGSVASMIAYILSFVVPSLIFVLMMRKHERVKPRFAFRMQWRDLALLPFVLLITFTFSFLNNLITGGIWISSLVEDAQTMEPYAMILMVISIAVIPALVEELLFRGCILQALLPYGQGVAILISSVLFGLMHQNPLQLLYTTVCGLVLGYAYVRTRSIWCSVLMHFVNNLISALMTILSYLLTPIASSVVLNLMQVAVILAGGVCAVIVMRMSDRKKENPYENGSFGRILDESEDYVAYPMEGGEKAKGFFSPSVIVFTSVVGASILLSWFAILLVGIFYPGGVA
jgi:membrane protease YdiL (CAAX protease family)